MSSVEFWDAFWFVGSNFESLLTCHPWPHSVILLDAKYFNGWNDIVQWPWPKSPPSSAAFAK